MPCSKVGSGGAVMPGFGELGEGGQFLTTSCGDHPSCTLGAARARQCEDHQGVSASDGPTGARRWMQWEKYWLWHQNI